MHYDKLLPVYIVMYRKKQEVWRAFLEVTARGGGCGDIGQSPDITIN